MLSESEGFWLESHWCAWSGFGTQPHFDIRGLGWSSGHTWNSVVINIAWVKVPSCQWPKVGLRGVKWLIVWANSTFCFYIFIAVFEKQANIRCSFDSISRYPISSRDHNATDQAITMGRYKTTTSENLIISFLENNKVQ